MVSVFFLLLSNCTPANKSLGKKASEILGDSTYLAISYGGYRTNSRDKQPTVKEIKDDMRMLNAMGISVLRTYNVHLPQASNVLKAIRELKEEDENFKMYVMLGAWIDCKDAWTANPIHDKESSRNAIEIQTAIDLANQYQDIVKILSVGNEAMVKWAASYYVEPRFILNWVNYLQGLKREDKLPSDLWITSSDDFSSWGGGSKEYHTKVLEKLYKAVDYVSIHTYPYHNTHYNPEFWQKLGTGKPISNKQIIDAAMRSALDFAKCQYDSVFHYMQGIGINKPIHIGETGWATVSNGFYGDKGSKAADEYKQGMYHSLVRDWTNKNGISCFYFEAFDEQWKDSKNPMGSENHFGLVNLNNEAKYALWSLVDKGVFNGLPRNGEPITKTYGGDIDSLFKMVSIPTMLKDRNE